MSQQHAGSSPLGERGGTSRTIDMLSYASPPQSSLTVQAGGSRTGADSSTSSSSTLNNQRRGPDQYSPSSRRDLPASTTPSLHPSSPSPQGRLLAASSASELRTEQLYSPRQPQQGNEYQRGGDQPDRRLPPSPFPRSPRAAPSPHRPYHSPSSTPQDQLERLAAEASSVAGGISGIGLITEPLPHSHTYHSRPSTADSNHSSGPSPERERQQVQEKQQQPLRPIPESASSVALTNKSPPPSSTPIMASTTTTNVGASKPIPRSSSIDSAISSVSAHSSIGHHSTPSSSSNNIFSNVTGTSPADIQYLIQAAGSAEDLVKYMLKEKNSMTAQNAQLWRLVDKQRAMILGLNKDLERALKEKDRYRKKLKEQMMGMAPPLPTGGSGWAPEQSRTMSESPAPSLAESRDERATVSPIDNGMHREALSPPPGRRPSGDLQNSPSSTLVTPGAAKLPLPSDPRHLHGSDSENDNHNIGKYLKKSTSTDLHTPPTGSDDEKEKRELEEAVASMSPPPLSIPEPEPRRDIESPTPISPGLPSPELSPRSGYVDAQEAHRAVSQPLPHYQLQEASRVSQIKKLGLSTAVPAASGLGKSPLRKAPPAPLDFSPHQHAPKSGLGRTTDNADDEDDEAKEIYEQNYPETAPLSQSSGNSWQPTPEDKKGHLPILREVAQPSDLNSPSLPAPIPEITRTIPPTPNSAVPDNLPASPRIKQQSVFRSLPSPGLPSSPRPIDRPLNSPKPRNSTLGLPTSPRAPLQSIPPYNPGTPRQSLPPPSAQSAIFPAPNAPVAVNYHERSGSLGSLVAPGHQKSASDGQTTLLIQPSAIPSIDARIVSSRMRPSRLSMMPGKSKNGEDSVFTLGVFSRADSREILRVEKDAASLYNLDGKLRKWISYSVKVPERAMFSGHAPARVDARRVAIDEYFNGVLGATMDERAALALCEFFSVDVVERSPVGVEPGSNGSSPKEAKEVKPVREGYLTKKGKNFGGWKERYFVLDGPILKYFDGPGGAQLGQIKLQQAQIGRQSSSKAKEDNHVDEDSQYRHAFLVLEPKRKDSSNLVRHVLCAESDAERDGWVNALLEYVDKGDSQREEEAARKKRSKQRDLSEEGSLKASQSQEASLRTLSYEDTNPGPAPARGPTPEEMQRQQVSPSPSSMLSQPASQQFAANSPVPERGVTKQISAPTGGSVISDLAAWGASKLSNQPTEKALKKRSIWGFRQRSSSDLSGQAQQQTTGQQQAAEKFPLPRAVFGASLDEAVYLSRPPGIDIALPAVVFRCIEYLEAKNASEEEGIFRLSGSSVVVKGLKEKFNSESDFNILAHDEYYDVHAIAGLLKLYLRELPTNILTMERREEFINLTKMEETKPRKVQILNDLVHSLPVENFTLLKTLSGHLLKIVDNADINKMTIRNVGIVFSPTLNIPAQVFSMFLHEYRQIFFRPDQSPTPSQQSTFSEHPPPSLTQRPSVSSQRDPPGTPTLLPAHPGPQRPPPSQPDPGNLSHQETSKADYEPVYQKVISPMRPTFDGHGGGSSGGLSLPDDGKSAKQRRRESNMFMMGGGLKKNGIFSPTKSAGPSAMVMEDSVYE